MDALMLLNPDLQIFYVVDTGNIILQFYTTQKKNRPVPHVLYFLY